jgi:hypothetical protein
MGQECVRTEFHSLAPPLPEKNPLLLAKRIQREIMFFCKCGHEDQEATGNGQNPLTEHFAV